ncbi:hypothetical protein DFH09DRAFT_1331495 [Mycena vulgaris]|nr:hypothetical protein DFH09DRAFT_1331495 [Mycena vulgaris]
MSLELKPDSQEDKPNYAICFCRSSDCKAQTWLSKDGQVKKGKWLHWSTIAKHTKKDTELMQENILPPAPQAASASIETEVVPPMPSVSTNVNRIETEPTPPRPVGGTVVA